MWRFSLRIKESGLGVDLMHLNGVSAVADSG